MNDVRAMYPELHQQLIALDNVDLARFKEPPPTRSLNTPSTQAPIPVPQSADVVPSPALPPPPLPSLGNASVPAPIESLRGNASIDSRVCLTSEMTAEQVRALPPTVRKFFIDARSPFAAIQALENRENIRVYMGRRTTREQLGALPKMISGIVVYPFTPINVVKEANRFNIILRNFHSDTFRAAKLLYALGPAADHLTLENPAQGIRLIQLQSGVCAEILSDALAYIVSKLPSMIRTVLITEKTLPYALSYLPRSIKCVIFSPTVDFTDDFGSQAIKKCFLDLKNVIKGTCVDTLEFRKENHIFFISSRHIKIPNNISTIIIPDETGEVARQALNKVLTNNSNRNKHFRILTASGAAALNRRPPADTATSSSFTMRAQVSPPSLGSPSRDSSLFSDKRPRDLKGDKLSDTRSSKRPRSEKDKLPNTGSSESTAIGLMALRVPTSSSSDTDDDVLSPSKS